MQRRTFIQCVGGGVIAAAAASSAQASLMSADMPYEAVVDWRGPPPDRDPRRWALGYAILAPNPHNRQPWLVDLREDNVITLFCDKERLLPETDPLGRQILIGHGCFLELLSIALAEAGFEADITDFPQGSIGDTLSGIGSKPIARISLKASTKRDPLFASILKRHTPKAEFDTGRAVSNDLLNPLSQSIRSPMLRFGHVTDAAKVAELRSLALDAAKIEFATERTMMESMRLIRIGPAEINQHRDGISINSPFLRIAAAIGAVNRHEFPKPGSMASNQSIERYQKATSTAPAFFWLSSRGNSRVEQLQAGRAYARLQLEATLRGLGVHPLSQALQEFAEMKPHFARIHTLLLGAAPTDTLQMFCRIGYPLQPATATPRRGVKAIIML
jgi:hypothetical protein